MEALAAIVVTDEQSRSFIRAASEPLHLLARYTAIPEM